ncbi:MAG: HlyD family efflux transporter periplasmic adaptor subunit [Saprospiraceae bacterium]
MNLTTRRLSLVGALLVLFGGIMASRYLSQQKAPPAKKPEAVTPTRKVEVKKVENGTVNTTVDVQGKVIAYDKIDLFSEVGGTLIGTGKPFKVGSYFKKGELMLQLDLEEARLNLYSQKSNLLNAISQMMPDLKIDYPESFPDWQSYIENFDIEGSIKSFPEPKSKREKYLVASRNLLSQFYSIKSAEERLSKYKIYAPFSGVLTATSIQHGALVRQGQKLGELMSTGSYELEATVPLSDMKFLGVGNKVTLSSPDIAGTWTGTVKRVSDQIDPATQSIKVYIGVSGSNLKEGMYLSGKVASTNIADSYSLPRKLLVNENEIYVVQTDSTLTLKEVEIEKLTANEVVIKGLENGTLILNQSPIGAYPGEKVIFNQ